MSYVPSFIQILLLFFKLSQISSVLQGFPTHGSKRVFWNLNNYITFIKLNKSTYFLLTYVSLDIIIYDMHPVLCQMLILNWNCTSDMFNLLDLLLIEWKMKQILDLYAHVSYKKYETR